MSGGFHSEDELRKMEQHPSVQAIRIGRTKPYDCSYPVMAETEDQGKEQGWRLTKKHLIQKWYGLRIKKDYLSHVNECSSE